MNKTRTAARCLIGAVATAAFVIGLVTAPAQASDTDVQSGASHTVKDTGWNPV